ncbi:MAG: c-type cytochrome [Acidimicrobiia bacterium]|nr:c-type cytochrome [Acidimicrobiia bacterium]
MNERRMRAALMAVVIAAAFAVAACSNQGGAENTGSRVVRGASADAGKTQIVRYGCGACHQIPGVDNANGLVGPPLIHFGKRGTIAGYWANTPDNLTDWIQDPQHMLPGNDMPTLGIKRDDVRNIAAYLESLQ